MATPIEQLAEIKHRAANFLDPREMSGQEPLLRDCLQTCHDDIDTLLQMIEQRTNALLYAVAVMSRIATERGMDECMAEDCTLACPRCSVKIAQAELAGKLGRWRC